VTQLAYNIEFIIIISGKFVQICLYRLKCTKFGQLILRKITEIVASRCQILRLKCIKVDFGWDSAPNPAGGAYSAPLDPLAGFKEPTSKGREGSGSKGKGEEKGRGREVCLSHCKFWDSSLCHNRNLTSTLSPDPYCNLCCKHASTGDAVKYGEKSTR